MNRQEYLLTKLAEEGSEIAQDASKILCFGMYETNHLNPDGPNNQERLINELNDLLGVVELMIDSGMLPAGWVSEEKIAAKKVKLLKYRDYGVSIGTIKE